MLKECFNSDKKIFKLVCGAGNEFASEVEYLTELYSKAGAVLFDISANPEILVAAKNGIKKSGISEDRYICVSVGMKGDPHISKACVKDKLCVKCGQCTSVCNSSAIKDGVVFKDKCIGCGACAKVCSKSAICMYEEDKDLGRVLPELVDMGIDCIELHATSEFDEDIWDKWEVINKCFDGMLSVCIDRLYLGNKQVLNRLKKMLESRKPYSTIIQADGIPMSASNDDYKTTLQAVSMAQIINNFELPVYVLLSGGTNSKTAQLAKMCDIVYSGIAVGSYARKIVKNKPYNEALSMAKELVSACIK